ncbi:MAG: DUF971 domain-containing protein [Limisphaerales bacterium]|nr:DUF971 domain-containing protein [Verrucomicrobiota bacterium]
MIAPLQMDLIGSELAILWNDGTEQFIPLKLLRKECPCAWCAKNAGTQSSGPAYTEDSFQVRSMVPVGGYAFQIIWCDGHAGGIYGYDYMRKLPNR